jgi:predicted RNA methylase
MRLRNLEAALSTIQRDFPSPKVDLEQYPTSAHLVANVIHLAVDHDDLGEGRTCLDLGCGTGMLAIGAAFVSDVVVGVDCDDEALQVAQSNAELVDLEESIHWVQAQVWIGRNNDRRSSSVSTKTTAPSGRGENYKKRGSTGGRGGGAHHNNHRHQAATATKSILIVDGRDGVPFPDNCVDTVLTNPPFGTKNDNAGIDIQFLRTATRLARRAVYSFHKRSTRPFILRTLQEDWGYTNAKVVAEMSFDIPHMYKFHNQKSKDVEVDLIRVDVTSGVSETNGTTDSDVNTIEVGVS